VNARRQPEDLHEWVSFEDPDGRDVTWTFDLTFMTSPWTCIFGSGCQGVLTEDASELSHGCCSYGAHLMDGKDKKNLLRHAKRLTATQWQNKPASSRAPLTEISDDGAEVTKLVDDACIFLNRVGFHSGPGCALHVAAVQAGERPMDWKPQVCWQVPLRLDEQTDDDGHVTSVLREWKRRDWGDGGSEFHWWCTDSSEAFVDTKQVWQTLRDEIIELTSQAAYDALAQHITSKMKAAARGNAPVFLPHPQVRRKRTRA
jgi:hypothetical protein